MTSPSLHATRDHALWSASATARNWQCPGALALGQTVRHLDVESEAAGWGTACHDLSEKCLRTGLDAADRIGETIKTKSHSFDVDEEMAECAQVYIDYVRDQSGKAAIASMLDRYGDLLFLETRFSLEKLNPPFDAGGTCDAIVYSPAEKLLEVIDLKGGRGVRVEVTENKQLRTYALGAMLAHPELKVDRVKSTIVQPRMEHKDGRIRSETLHVTELMEWTAELCAAMERSAAAIAKHTDIKGDLMRDAWAERWLEQGAHCTFCPAAGICPALQAKAMATANAFFNDSGATVIRNQPEDLDPARIGQVLDGADDLQNWLNAVRALGTRLAQTGTDIPGHYLAEKHGHRKFRDPDTAPAALELLGLSHADIYAAPKPKTPAQVEKALGAKRLKSIKEHLDALVHKPVTGVTLVSSAKSSKPPVKAAAERFFT
jgi:hypothetical protein